MNLLPVVVREMSVLARRKSTYWSRTVTGLLALLLMLWLLVVSRAHVSYAAMGKSLFFVLSSVCFAFCVLVGTQATSDSVSEEKREGTLGLLFLTDLKGFDVISGKLAATSLWAVIALMGVIPMLSLALLLGGVTFIQFGLTTLVLANTMFFSLALGVFVSTLCENERKAMSGTFVGLVYVLFAPALFVHLLRARFPWADEISLFSPLYAFTAVQQSNPAFGMLLPRNFWSSVISTHLLAWLLLIASSLILPRYVNVLPSTRFARLRNWTHNFVYGRIEQRKKHRAQLLDRNAFLWLASRERVKPKYAWGLIAFFAALYIWIAMQFPGMMFDFAVAGVIMFLLHFVFKIWAASEVCSRLIQDRRSGALELLLSTPLSVKEIAAGQTKALGRLFLKPIAFLICLECVLLHFGLRTFGDLAESSDKVLLYVVAISTFLLDLWALKWVGLWLSLKGKSMERVLLGTVARILAIPWLIFALFMGLITSALLLQNRAPTKSEVMAGWWLISIVIALTFGLSARWKFLRQFRELASRRFQAVVQIEEVPVRQAATSKLRIPLFVRRHPVTTGIFLALALIMVAGGIRGRYWDQQVENEFSAIRGKGYPVSLEDLHRFYPTVAPSQNAFAMLDATGPVVMPTRGLNPARRVSSNITPEELQAFRNLLGTNSAALKAMWKLPEFTKGSFAQLNVNFWMPQQMQSGYMAVVDADLMDMLHREDPPDVARIERDVFALLAHARLLREQPLGFAQDKAYEALFRLAGALSFLFKRDLLDDEALARLQQEVNRADATNILARTLAVHRANMIQMHRNPNAFAGMGFAVPAGFSFLESVLAAAGFADQQLLRALKSYEIGIAASERPLPERLDLLVEDRQSPWPGFSRLGITFYQESLSNLFWKDASYSANLNLIRAAVAAKRYQLRHGKLPEKLQALEPEFLSSVPIDPFTGKPLRSIRSDELMIYSVGLDRMDNTAPNTPGSSLNPLADMRLPVK